MAFTDSTPEFQPAKTKRASEVIFDQIREMIVAGELKPGDRLPNERTLIEQFGRSRPTIREALRMLERGRYIRCSAGSNGAVILNPGTENMQETMEDALRVGYIDISEMREYRSVCESATMVWACARRTEEDLQQIRAQLDKMADTVDDCLSYVALDAEFHALLAAASKNSVNVIMNNALGSVNKNYMLNKMAGMTAAAQKKMTKRVHNMHVAIYEAIAAQDAEAAQAAMNAHLAAFEEDLK